MTIRSIDGPRRRWRQNSPRTLEREAAAAAAAKEKARILQCIAAKVAAQASAKPRGQSYVTFPDEPALAAAEPAVRGARSSHADAHTLCDTPYV